MKNVAGYDVSRLLAGSLGTLGLIAEVSIKVLPLPASEATLRLEMTEARALERSTAGPASRCRSRPAPGTAATCGVRLSGSEAAVRAAAAKIGGDRRRRAGGAFWSGVREHDAPVFRRRRAAVAHRRAVRTPPLRLPGGR